jgi:7-carboxy-7-deazaguanine synthase
MSKIKISELFYSIQGEGRYMGVPSVFLRTFGCNFTCGGFGMPKGMLSQERDQIKAEDFNDYKSLPLVSTGCDSYASWDPRFKHLSPMLDTDTIVSSIMDLLPGNRWMDEHLVITGGEPLLGWQRSYPELLNHRNMIDLKEVTFETNGTQELTDEFFNYLMEDAQVNEVTFSVSPKLSVSGERWEDAIKPNIVCDYALIGYTYLKFVVTGEQDTEEIIEAVNTYRKAGFQGPVYLMPVGGVENIYSLHNKKVAELAMKLGYRYSDRLQVPLFKNAWGT